MKMTDKISNARKPFLHGRYDSDSHVVNQSHGISILFLDALKKRDQPFLSLGRNFNTAQHNLRDPIYPTKEIRAVSFARSVDMQNIAAPLGHGTDQLFFALSMRQRQINNKLSAQISYLPFRHKDVLGCKIFQDFQLVAAIYNKGLAHLYDD